MPKQSDRGDENEGRGLGTEPAANAASLAPTLSLPKGGGAVHGIGEKFGTNPVTGTGATSVPIPTSPSRSGFGPQLALSYDSGAGNGPFGLGWTLGLPAITRKTDKGIPQYDDGAESDVFLLAGSEDLVAIRLSDGSLHDDTATAPGFAIRRYRPRREAAFARVERWTDVGSLEVHWRSISRDNVTTFYGQTADSRIADPAGIDAAHGQRVFAWLICETRDDKGNVVEYGYKAEDSTGIPSGQTNEVNRTPAQRSANRYLKRVRYGNTISRLDVARWPTNRWMFELVLDYGEHDPLVPTPGDGGDWFCRNDPSSSYRSAFPVRTYRLCQRFLMFHHFEGELDVGVNCLVRSLDLAYRSSRGIASDARLGNSVVSLVASATSAGYRRDGAGGYVRRELPPLELEYSDAVVSGEVRTIDPESLENVPVGLDGNQYQWLDLYGEGVSGIFTEQGDAWYYKRNLSPVEDSSAAHRPEVRFAPVEQIAIRPSMSLAGGGAHLMDLAGDGRPDVVMLEGPTPGFFELGDDDEWRELRAFTSRPTVAIADSDLRLIDLDGDGHADLLVTEDRVLTWYQSLGEAGFAAPARVPKPFDDEAGPAIVFADETLSIYLADMSGDGLTDIVRIRNGEICYWPNMGYGTFGAKVTMDASPWFGSHDSFDPRRVRIADIDGSGCADILYLDGDGVRIHVNQAGNGWSDALRLPGFPRIDDVASVSVVDLFGNGTACLVWSSGLAGDAGRQMRYVDLMGGAKPHLLVALINNLGTETRMTYASSAKFYLRDRAAGRPWITKLPFPVHVVERVDVLDRISGNAFVTRYAYHHGYFDGEEREFRGFGMVEQWDTEEYDSLRDAASPAPTNVDAASNVPPMYTKRWYHTGIFVDRDRISDYFGGHAGRGDASEYYREPAWRTDDVEARRHLLDDTVLPHDVLRADGSRDPYTLTSAEEREACRALRGAMLRQETYGLDGSAMAEHPYGVTEQNFTVELLQPRGAGRHAVFFMHAREAIEHHYERSPEDPRIAHTLTLDVDPFGSVLRSVSIAYGRRVPDPSIPSADRAEQARLHATCSESDFTNAVDTTATWRAPQPSESRAYEVTGLALAAAQFRFTFEEVGAAVKTAAPITFEVAPTPSTLQKRLVAHGRTLYRPDDLGVAKNDPSALLPLGVLEPLAIPGESYRLAMTAGLVAAVYGARVTDAMLANEARFVHWAGDADWWVPSGRAYLSPSSSDTAAQELATARAHFFLPRRFRNPFHLSAQPTEHVADYDPYDLLVLQTRDALGNRVTAGERDAGGAVTLTGNDYRVLQPRLLMDANGNRSAAAFDALGMVTATAVMGKPAPSAIEGDSLAGLDVDVAEATVLAHLAAPLVDPAALLQRASTRLVYDLFAYSRTKLLTEPQAAVVYTLARETHDSEPVPAGGLRVQHSFSYSDGFGREIQRKVRAEGGRWVGTGWTVFNNKGKPVRQFEPFFTGTHHFERDVRVGVSPVLFYDPLGRVVATLLPDHTWQKVLFGPWRQETWDASDTVLIPDPAADADVGDFFARLPHDDYLPTWHALRSGGALGADDQEAARKAGLLAASPTVAHADSLGRPMLSIAHNRAKYSDTPLADPPVEAFLESRATFDIAGNTLSVTDSAGRLVMRYDCDMLGARIHQTSMEAGARWTLSDVAEMALYSWDSRDHRFRTVYDVLRRPIESYVKEGAAAELLVGRIAYGETAATPEADNLRERIVEQRDQAGVVTSAEYDFKGNLLRANRQLASAYSTTLDWSSAVPMDAAIYVASSRFDALNRCVQSVAPHVNQPGATVSVVQPTFNEANLLEQVDVWLDQPAEPPTLLAPATASLHAVANIDYDAKAQRTAIAYGNGVTTTYSYDASTQRLALLVTRRAGVDLQRMRYTYDAAGNVTHVQDDAQQTVFFSNRRVEPSADYTYDALHRLIEATGREHLGQVGAAPVAASYDDAPRVGVSFSAEDGTAMGRYLERYVYDVVGNFLSVEHGGSDPVNPGWTRSYVYDEPSQLEPARRSNRLTGTAANPAHPERYSVGGNGYDAHGNMLRMPHLQELQWGFRDELRMTRRQAIDASDANGAAHAGERTWYVYDASGQRVRKVTESAPGTIKEERIYLGGIEIYRRAGANALVRETLHVMDDARRIALVETRTAGSEPGVSRQRVRYQMGNHLESASLELDETGQVISYEEYTPYGSTSYQAVRGQQEAAKRYRYTGKERDEESGLYYHGARYYAPWIGRWTSCDPSGIRSATNLYQYASCRPINLVDPDGKDPVQPNDKRTPEERERSYSDPAGNAAVARESASASSSSWNTVKLLAVVAVGMARTEAIRAGAPPWLVDFQHVTELGWARKAFIAGTTGYPFEPPTDPADQAEWERGEDLAAITIAAEMISSGGGGAPPSQQRQLVTAGGGGVPGRVAAVPAAAPLGPMVYMASKKKEAAKTAEEAPAASAKGGKAEGPGEWVEIARSKVGTSLETQSSFSEKIIRYAADGKAYIQEYRLLDKITGGHVDFDRFKDGVLGEVKDNYAFLVKMGSKTAADQLLREAAGQIRVAKQYGLKIEWYVRSDAVEGFRKLLSGIKEIEVKSWTPQQAPPPAQR